MANKNFQIAKFYSRLFELKEEIQNDLIPLGTHIGALDQNYELSDSLNDLVSIIDEHHERFELSVIDHYPPK